MGSSPPCAVSHVPRAAFQVVELRGDDQGGGHPGLRRQVPGAEHELRGVADGVVHPLRHASSRRARRGVPGRGERLQRRPEQGAGLRVEQTLHGVHAVPILPADREGPLPRRSSSVEPSDPSGSRHISIRAHACLSCSGSRVARVRDQVVFGLVPGRLIHGVRGCAASSAESAAHVLRPPPPRATASASAGSRGGSSSPEVIDRPGTRSSASASRDPASAAEQFSSCRRNAASERQPCCSANPRESHRRPAPTAPAGCRRIRPLQPASPVGSDSPSESAATVAPRTADRFASSAASEPQLLIRAAPDRRPYRNARPGRRQFRSRPQAELPQAR